MSEKVLLLESTDPINGFIDNQEEIERRLAEYVSDNIREKTLDGEYVFDANLNGQLDFANLPGLHYYNEAVESFNNSNLQDAIVLLQKAELFYHSERVKEFGSVLANALLSSDNIKRDEKRAFLSRISVVKESSDLVSVN